MNKSELMKLKKDELLEICKKNKIKADRKLKKEELISLLLSESKKEKKKPETKKKSAKAKPPERLDDIAKVEKSKFEISREERAKEKEVEITEVLPESYNEDRLVILVRDPYLAYAYWDFSKKTIKDFGLDKEGSKIIIRTYDIEKKFFDLELPAQMRNCYFQLPHPGKKYYSEIGVVRNNKFIPIARSNEINVPPDRATLNIYTLREEEYKKAEELFRQSGGYIIRKLVGSDVVLEWRSIGAGEWSGISSGSGGFAFEKKVEKKACFDLNVNTELVIYGSTSADARLTIGGVPVELTPEGKFSIRFYLKDGEFEIPIIAVSSSNMKKIEVVPIVYKTTRRKES